MPLLDAGASVLPGITDAAGLQQLEELESLQVPFLATMGDALILHR